MIRNLIFDNGFLSQIVNHLLFGYTSKYINISLSIYTHTNTVLKNYVFRESYLRFSSQIFSLSNYHESVHLTNNAVQTKYKNNGSRDKALPDENMWDCHTFKAYLR